MKEIQKLLEAIIGLILGIVLLQALPQESFFLGLIPFLIIFVAIIILIFKWFVENLGG